MAPLLWWESCSCLFPITPPNLSYSLQQSSSPLEHKQPLWPVLYWMPISMKATSNKCIRSCTPFQTHTHRHIQCYLHSPYNKASSQNICRHICIQWFKDDNCLNTYSESTPPGHTHTNSDTGIHTSTARHMHTGSSLHIQHLLIIIKTEEGCTMLFCLKAA